MKRVLALFGMFLAAAFLMAAADYSATKQGVVINYRDGKSEKVKLDFIDNDNVMIIKQGSSGKLETIKIPRAKVDSLSIDGKDYSDRFGAGDEGFVMNDGRVLKGIVEGLDETTFWRRLSQGGKTERLDRDNVAFIQFRKPVPAEHGEHAQIKKFTVEVSAKQAWTLTNVIVKAGQRVSFMTDPSRVVMCGGIPNVNADGVDPYTPNPQRPLPDGKACALIAKIGTDIFRVGTNQTPFVAKQDGELILGINDSRFVGNGGAFSVLVVIEE